MSEHNPPPAETSPDSQAPSRPELDVRRLLVITAIVVAGLGYFFWDDIRDVITPPTITAPSVPADTFREDKLISVKVGPLDITFSKVAAAITAITWTDPNDPAHHEPLISQDGLPNRALVVELPGRKDWVDREFAVAQKKDADGRITQLTFTYDKFDDGLQLVKTFTFAGEKQLAEGMALIQLTIEIKHIPAGGWLRKKGYTLRLCNAVGLPDDLDKDDGLVSVRANRITDHHNVRKIRGVQEWPTDTERERAGHAHIKGTPTLEWVAAASKYFGLILTPQEPAHGAEMSFTRTHRCGASVALRMPPPTDPDLGVRDTFHIYAGPKDYDRLARLGGRQQEAINYWYFGREATLLLKLLYHTTVPNYGVAIILLTLIFRLLMWPVTRYNLRSMVDIKLANARLEDIDAREPPRTEVQAHEYWLKEARVWEKVQSRATLGVFLPLAILLPILLILYYTLNAGYEFYRKPFVLWITDISSRDPYFLLPILMGAAMLAQLRTMSENPARERNWIIMPAAFTVLFAFFSAGLVLFWFTDSLAGWLQLAIIKRGRARRGGKGESPIEKADRLAAEIRAEADRGSGGASDEEAAEGPDS